jgi:Sec-independent protein secretion pathway component TatC
MQKAEHDKSIGRVDSKTLRSARRFSFWAIALCVVGVLLTDSNPIAQLMLYVSTGAVLMVDIIAMIFRPPATGHRAASVVGSYQPLRRLISVLRRH